MSSSVRPTPGFAHGFARTPQKSLYPNLWQGLVGAYAPSLGIQGQKLYDFSPYKKDGTLTNMTNDAWVPGYSGHALTYTTDDYISLPDGGAFDVTKKCTLMAWIRPTITSRMILYSRDLASGATVLDYEINHLTGGANSFGFRMGSVSTESIYAAGLTQNVWNHIAIVHNSTTASDWTFYLNGLKVSTSVATSDTIVNNTTNARIGTRAITGSALPFGGDIGDLYLYDRDLQQPEIFQAYSGATPFHLKPTSSGFVPLITGMISRMMLMGMS